MDTIKISFSNTPAHTHPTHIFKISVAAAWSIFEMKNNKPHAVANFPFNVFSIHDS